MKNFLAVILIAAAAVLVFIGLREKENLPEQKTLDPDIAAHIESKSDLIRVSAPQPNDVITSPLVVQGEARGNWYFEASFPITIVDWDGRIIAEHYAIAQGEWMTTEFLPFEGTIEFENPYIEGSADFMKRGTIIFRKDNPSGLPEHDDALEIPIRFSN